MNRPLVLFRFPPISFLLSAALISILSFFGSSLQATSLLDENGARVLSPLPEPGVHPRLFFTAEELPRIRERLDRESDFAFEFGKVSERVNAQVMREYWDFSVADFSNPTIEELNEHIRPDEGRNSRWGMASLYAVLYEDESLKQVMIGTIVNYATLLLASREMKAGGDLKKRTGLGLGKQFNIWENNSFDVGVSWTLGASGYALSYDVLYNDMTEEQRAVVRRAIAVSTKGRFAYGMGRGRGFAASNHYGYHGDLAALLAVIEGEEGYDQETFDNISQVLRDYWEVGFTPAGACHEDGYGPNLGLRAGGRGFLVLARRGYNIFETQKFRNFIDYFALEYEPHAGGKFMGGASGGPYDWLYPTAALLSRYMYPDSASANYVYRYTFGDRYERGFKWQGWLDFMVYGDQWKGPEDRSAALEAAELPLTVYYPARGKQIFRSDWTEDALQFTLDARPDAFLIGHDRVDRGNITMSALGRNWAFAGDFREYRTSQEHSLVHIDGIAQAYKAPSVRFLWQQADSLGAIAVADLKYAYDWEWTPPWPKMDTPAFQSWEQELSSPLDLGWPSDYQPDWLPGQLFGSESGYSHTNGLRRRPYNTVEKAIRASIAVRGEHSFVIVADEIKKDHDKHSYEWYLQIPTDLEVKKQAGRDLILGEVGAEPVAGARCLLVRVLRAEAQFEKTPDEIDFLVEEYVAHYDKRNDRETKAKRVIFSVESVEPHFRVMLLPFKVGELLPETKVMPDEIRVLWSDQTSRIRFRESDDKGLLIKLD